MQNRVQLINYLIDAYGYKSYLEIGVKHQSRTFNKINAIDKTGVDPNGCTHFTMTSDEFFKQNKRNFDLIFIDGLHERKQVKKDILNSLEIGKTIICHDVNPTSEFLLANNFCWNAWEAFAELRATRSDLFMCVFPFDYLGLIKKGKQKPYWRTVKYNYQYLNKYRLELMNQLTFNEFQALHINKV